MANLASVAREYRWQALIIGVAIAVHLAMMGSLFWGYIDPLFHSTDRSTQAVDFFAIYEAGDLALRGEDLYNVRLVDEESDVPYFSGYRYVPMFAYVAGIPAHVLSPWNAYWAMVAINELLLVVCALLTWRLSRGTVWGAVAVAMWLTFKPFYVEQIMGQFSFLMATLLFVTGIGIVSG
jgi:hypothetical protein